MKAAQNSTKGASTRTVNCGDSLADPAEIPPEGFVPRRPTCVYAHRLREWSFTFLPARLRAVIHVTVFTSHHVPVRKSPFPIED